ncbi:LURP-one-related/scramblase family protein [Lactovum miscens]|uniref:Uncharacterized protein YxjI n=1 Tax=Lactovum miscens TaxID=190387 RepID=A0A841C9N8_9LACT|nr:LURP-one-related family protein [Lactovum miscens]MBB5887910.1 uncharacterized protein YxjI [Lactovum miscens]
MSILIVNQKLLSWGRKFLVTDEEGIKKYDIVSSLFKIPKEFMIYDNFDQLVGKVTHKAFSFLPKSFLELNGQIVATISKKFTFFKPKYNIDAGNITIEGSILDLNYEIQRDGITIGSIDKNWFSYRDKYSIEVQSEKDELLILGLVLAIDNAKSQEPPASTPASSSF